MNRLEDARRFQPSGIAIHPGSNDIFIISSTGKILIILNREGKIISFKHLEANIYSQPEGICFSPSGDLFISNEGKTGKGYILRFFQRKSSLF